MQNAKDTFYVTLRDRLAGLNSARTITVRGVARPGSLVEENELVSATQPADAFCLHWTEMKLVAPGEMPLISMRCEVRYSTAGSAESSGMDRGRLLAEMDAELTTAISTAPQNALKMRYAAGSVATAMQTKVFWGEVLFASAIADGERLSRMATVEVFTYQEAEEL